MTSVSGKMKDIPVTVAVTSGSERGLYINPVNPTGFAPVTNQAREFDWYSEKNYQAAKVACAVVVIGVPLVTGAIIAAPLIGTVGAAIGTYTATATAATALFIKEMVNNNDTNKSK